MNSQFITYDENGNPIPNAPVIQIIGLAFGFSAFAAAAVLISWVHPFLGDLVIIPSVFAAMILVWVGGWYIDKKTHQVKQYICTLAGHEWIQLPSSMFEGKMCTRCCEKIPDDQDNS